MQQSSTEVRPQGKVEMKIKMAGSHWSESTAGESPLAILPLRGLLFSFEGEGEVAPHCGHSHILQSRGGGSKKQNNQKKRSQGPWGEDPVRRHRINHQEGLSSA